MGVPVVSEFIYLHRDVDEIAEALGERYLIINSVGEVVVVEVGVIKLNTKCGCDVAAPKWNISIRDGPRPGRMIRPCSRMAVENAVSAYSEYPHLSKTTSLALPSRSTIRWSSSGYS
jgi:hypothetical protein